MKIALLEQAFNPWQEIDRHQQSLCDLAGQYGATGVFVGTMRDFNQGDEVVAMFLEHYPGMTEKQLQHIAEQAQQRWQVLDCLLLHRIGAVQPDDTLVTIAVWSAHRGDAFDASRFMMEQLKSAAPFWKKEILAGGRERWVEKNSSGYHKDR